MSNAPVFSLSASQKLLFGYIILMILTKVQSQDFCRNYCRGVTDGCTVPCANSGGRVLPVYCLFEMFEEEPTDFAVFKANVQCQRIKVVFDTVADGYLKLDQATDSVVVKGRVDSDVSLSNGQRLELLYGAIGCNSDQSADMMCFAIQVKDINDNLPQITNSEYSTSVTEVAIQFSSKDLIVSPSIEMYDIDESGSLSYGILEENVPFRLVPMSYVPGGLTTCQPEKDFKVIVTDSTAVDYETQNSYSLTIAVWEGCGSSGDRDRMTTAKLTITVLDADDEFPFFHSGSYTATVLETIVNERLIVSPVIQASDGDRGLDVPMVYSLKNVNEASPNCINCLQIDSVTAEIIIIAELSYDPSGESCRLLVEAQQADNQNRKTQSPLTVTIIDANNKCPNFEHARYDGNFISGDNIVTESTTGNALIVKVLDQDSVFIGDVSSSRYFTKADFRNFQNEATLKLSAIDNTAITGDVEFKLTVSDDSLPGCRNKATVSVTFIEETTLPYIPRFTETAYFAEVFENSPRGTVISDIVSVVDTTSLIEYRITGASLQGNLFIGINETTGDVYVTENIDYEALGTAPVFELIIEAKDVTWSYPRFAYTTLSVSIKDEDEYPPELQGIPANLTVLENTPLDTVIFNALVTDRDGTQPNEYLFSLSGSAVLDIDNNGMITVTDELDAEIVSSLAITITVRESKDASMTDTGKLEVTIIDLNDNAPIFVPSDDLAVPENDPTPFTFKVTAEDDDASAPNNEIISYQIINAPLGTSIDSVTGDVTMSVLADRELADTITVVILASDGGRPQLDGLANVTINVLDVNETPEFVDDDCEGLNVDENTVTSLCVIQAVDFDEEFNVLRYSIEEDHNGLFFIDPSKGTLETSSPGLDREVNEEYTITIVASDNGSPSLSVSKNLRVTVNDLNDNDPVFDNTDLSFEVIEDFGTDCNLESIDIPHLYASDNDATEIHRGIRYYIDGERFNFNVDPVTGELLNSACIDADLGETSYTFNLVAYNYPSTSIQNGTLSLTLNIHDINDNPPNLVNYGKKVLERELITPGEQLFNITISDSDLTEQNRVSSSLCSFHPRSASDIVQCIVSGNDVIVNTKEDAVVTEDLDVMITVTARNIESPFFTTYEDLQLVVTPTDVPIIFDDQIVYITEGYNTGRFYNPIVTERNCLNFSVETEKDIFSIVPGRGSTSTIVSVQLLDFEAAVQTYHVHVLVQKGIETSDGCDPVGVNDSAVLTVYVIDVNDEPPQFVVSTGFLFEAVFFDADIHSVAFNLADQAQDGDRSASLEFTLELLEQFNSTHHQSNPLTCRKDGTVFLNDNFILSRKTDSSVMLYRGIVTDVNTQQNTNFSSINVKFGILGWDNILIFKSRGLNSDDDVRVRRQTSSTGLLERIEKCREDGQVGWWDESGQSLFKIERIIVQSEETFVWIYGINSSSGLFMNKHELMETQSIQSEILERECRLEEVKVTERRSFLTYPLHIYAFILIAAILLVGAVIMIIHLLCSWNQYLKEKIRMEERFGFTPVIENDIRNPDMDMPSSLPESDQTSRSAVPLETFASTSKRRDRHGDTLPLVTKTEASDNYAHLANKDKTNLATANKEHKPHRLQSPVVCLKKNQSMRSNSFGKDVLLNGDESSTDPNFGGVDGPMNTDEPDNPRLGAQRTNMAGSDNGVGGTLSNELQLPAWGHNYHHETSETLEEISSVISDNIYESVDGDFQTQL